MKILSAKKAKKINLKKEYAKRYLLKYIKELKVHFDLSERDIADITREIFYSKTALYQVINQIGGYFKGKK